VKEFAALFSHELINVLRARWLFLYGLLFGGFTIALARFASAPLRATAGLLSIVLLIVPLVSILYAAIYWYNSEPFTTLLLTQPLKRRSVYLATWAAISVSLGGSFTLSTGAALGICGMLGKSSLLLLFFGFVLSLIFVGIGLLLACLVSDRMKGIGLVFLAWLYFALLHDALVFSVVSTFRDYPVEVPSLLLMATNPIDLVRVSLLLSLDLSAMMGYTGRILQTLISDSMGLVLTLAVLFFWTAAPLAAGVRVFERKDL
jgi:Cu-processing system permease protein